MRRPATMLAAVDDSARGRAQNAWRAERTAAPLPGVVRRLSQRGGRSRTTGSSKPSRCVSVDAWRRRPTAGARRVAAVGVADERRDVRLVVGDPPQRRRPRGTRRWPTRTAKRSVVARAARPPSSCSACGSPRGTASPPARCPPRSPSSSGDTTRGPFALTAPRPSGCTRGQAIENRSSPMPRPAMRSRSSAHRWWSSHATSPVAPGAWEKRSQIDSLADVALDLVGGGRDAEERMPPGRRAAELWPLGPGAGAVTVTVRGFVRRPVAAGRAASGRSPRAAARRASATAPTPPAGCR
jgi:hypothetical protein